MQLLLKSYQPQDIYNTNETRIIFCALPGNTYVNESWKKTVKGFKMAKDHMTLIVAYDMNVDKEDLLLIKNVKMHYDFSTNPLMTQNIYGRWFRSWACRLQESGRQEVVLLDNSSFHVS